MYIKLRIGVFSKDICAQLFYFSKQPPIAGGVQCTHESTAHYEYQYLVRAMSRISINCRKPLPKLPVVLLCTPGVCLADRPAL